MQYPPPIQRLMDHFRMLPGVGPKTAARFVMHLLKKSEDELRAFGHALVDLKQNTRLCGYCFNFTLQNPCEICSSSQRDKSIICVVSKPQDLLNIESTGEYNGLYHVLHGTLNPIEGITPDQLRIKQLLERVEKQTPTIKEIILALNPDMEGESTAIYLTKLLQKDALKITRLARGLPMGSDLEYADEVTLTAALKGRREV